MSTGEHLDKEKLVELMITQSETEANIVKSLLEASQIHCVLVTQVPHNVYPFTINGLAAIKIKVLDWNWRQRNPSSEITKILT